MTARVIEPFGGPVNAVIRPPGSKSITNRVLVVAALATGESTLEGVLFADDTEAMLAGIAALGAKVEIDRDRHRVVVTGTGGIFRSGDVFANQSGTTARFLAAASVVADGPVHLDADEAMRRRPMNELFEVLSHLGVAVQSNNGALPATIDGGNFHSVDVEIGGDTSSQFLSALLLAGPCFAEGLSLRLRKPLVSRPYVDMTLQIMREFGAEVSVTERDDVIDFHVLETGYQARRYDIEPDASAASYFFALPMVCGGQITVDGLGRNSLQGDTRFVDVLEQMGAQVEKGDYSITVRNQKRDDEQRDNEIHGIDVDLADLSDTAQTLAAVAVFANGKTRISGIGFIRKKETDRIGAVVTELQRLGVQAASEDDGMVINGGPINAAEIETYQDHRMAMSFSVIGAGAEGVTILNPECVTKTYPTFFEDFENVRQQSKAEKVNVIAIDGPAGSGKSTVARAVSDATKLSYLDTGAMYRSVAWVCLQQGIDMQNAAAVAEAAHAMDLQMHENGTVLANGTDVTAAIRTDEVNAAVSIVAAITEVRAEMRRRQRQWAFTHGGGVMEGRDIGSVVFADARLKVYLDARPEVRAARRSAETQGVVEKVQESLLRRDEMDSTRAADPLRVSDDAVVIDTSDMTIVEVVETIVDLYRQRSS